MAGHSKWANIKHRKAAQDSKRGKIFTRLIREIVVAASASPNPDDNSRLRAAIDNALSNNMKKDTIDKAIIRGSGGSESENYQEVVYEGYGPLSSAIIVEAMTDNKNRTVAEVRHCFSKRGGSMGAAGSVAYMFNKVGSIFFEDVTDSDALMECALEVECEDVIEEDNSLEIITSWERLLFVKDTLEKKGYKASFSEITMKSSTLIEIDTKEKAEKVQALIDDLEDLDDTQNVYSNIYLAGDALEV